MRKLWKRIVAWWTRADRLEAQVRHFERERNIAVDALKKIATGAQWKEVEIIENRYYHRSPVDIAHDCLTKELGLMAVHVDENCPPDQIFIVPRGWMGRPTDYM